MALDYVITNNNKVFVKLNDNGLAETCSKPLAQHFTYDKAKNILEHLPKNMKKFHFKIEAIHEVVSESKKVVKKKTIQRDDYEPSENVTQWIEKFGSCSDILHEAEQRAKQLIKELENIDNEILKIIHIAEIEKSKDLYGGWQIYIDIRTNRRKRRDIKDELMIVYDVLQEINPSCLSREKVQKAIDGLSKRKYTYKIIEESDEDVV